MVDWRKYARIERERRFLLSSPPHPATVVHVRTIVDRYFDGTRLRLRRYNEVDRDPSTGDSSPAVTVCKLTQKVPDPGPSGQQGLITNTYLSEAEYELLARLPCRPLKKTRYSVPPFGVDVSTRRSTGWSWPKPNRPLPMKPTRWRRRPALWPT